MTTDFGPAFTIEGRDNPAPVLLVCEHASNHFPAITGDLGLDEDSRNSHVAWDIGARALSRSMAARLNAPLVLGQISRLIYDCNRPPEAPDAMPERSEVFAIPGNADLSDRDKAARATGIYEPFHAEISRQIAARAPLSALVTIHSFTPVYHGTWREVEIGILHGRDARLALAMQEIAVADHGILTRINEPYGPEHGVTHTIDRHGSATGLLNVMIEVRNDLLAVQSDIDRIAKTLCGWLTGAMAQLQAEGAL